MKLPRILSQHAAPRRLPRLGVAAALAATTLALAPAGPAAAVTPRPEGLPGMMLTAPFRNTTAAMRDNEGSAYVARDDSIWLAQDRGRIFEADATTGDLVRAVSPTQFAAVRPVGGGPLATTANYTDIESLAYDADSDVLYVFSGSNTAGVHVPTVFRLTRSTAGSLRLKDYKLLPPGSDFTGAAWNAANDTLYVGKAAAIRTYDFASNTTGPVFGVSGIGHIHGMDFSPDGSELFVSTTTTTEPSVVEVTNVAWPAKTVSWSLNVKPGGVKDARAVAYVDGALYVSDGFDDPTNPRTEHAVYVFGQRKSTPAVTAGFKSSATTGAAPMDVQFTDTSTGSPTRWSWNFGDGTTSTQKNPAHTFTKPGLYTVTLTARSLTNSGTSSARIEVKQDLKPPSATYSVPSGAVWAKYTKVVLAQSGLQDDFTPNAEIKRTVAWGDGTTSATLGHVYQSAGSFPVTVALEDNAGNKATFQAGTVAVGSDTVAPVVSLKRPINPTSVASWRTLRGSAGDAASGLRNVKLRIIEKRFATWFAYNGTTKTWARTASRTAAQRATRPVVVSPSTSSWSYGLPGLRKGYLVITVTAADLVGNTSPVKTYSQTLSKR